MGILGGGVQLVFQILTLFQTKKCHFPHPFSDLAFRWKLCHTVITYIRAQAKISSNAFRIHLFLVLSYSFGIETINTSTKPYPIPD